MKDKGKSEKADDSKVLCHENKYRRNCQTGPLKTDRSELCPLCPIRDTIDHELNKNKRFYSEQKALLSTERFLQLIDAESILPTELIRQAIKDSDSPKKGLSTNWEGCNTAYIVGKEYLQQLKEFREGKEGEKDSISVTNQKSDSEFTSREIDVIRRIDSMTYKEIGNDLNITESAVKERVKSIFSKTGIRKKAGIMKYFKENPI